MPEMRCDADAKISASSAAGVVDGGERHQSINQSISQNKYLFTEYTVYNY